MKIRPSFGPSFEALLEAACELFLHQKFMGPQPNRDNGASIYTNR